MTDDRAPGTHEPQSRLPDTVLAVLAVAGGVTLVVAGQRQRVGLGLFAAVLLAAATFLAVHTAVVGRRHGSPWFVAGLAAAGLLTGLFLVGLGKPAGLGIPMVALLAGMGRTSSWRLRTVALGAVVVLAVVAWHG